MKVHIFRGQNQIGGSIIEVSSETTKVILDVGSELGEEIPTIPHIDGLFQGKAGYNAVFATHYHSDHIGLLEKVLPEIPVYMGSKAAAIYRASGSYLGKAVKMDTNDLLPGKQIAVGDMEITPLLCDHSAFDSYMLLIKCRGKKLLYTGDFRANGRKNFAALLRRLPPVDILLTEGTTLSGAHTTTLSERELEDKAVQLISSRPRQPIFVFMAATNIDRLVTVYRAAKRTRRVLLQDVYTASIATAAAGHIPNPSTFFDVKVFLTSPGKKQYSILQQYPNAKIGRAGIVKHRLSCACAHPCRSIWNGSSVRLIFPVGFCSTPCGPDILRRKTSPRSCNLWKKTGYASHICTPAATPTQRPSTNS